MPKLEETTFPLDSFREAAIHLRRPFTAEAVKWKVQTGTLVVPYIDARLAIERLNLVVPHLWHDEYEPVAGGKGLLCRLTVDGITRLDVGSGYEGKGLYSDAFKRAGVKFGIGVSLYALPKVFLSTDNGRLNEKEVKGKKVLVLTDVGQKWLDGGYRTWLGKTGEEMFGAALDHGDAADAIGDVEAERETTSNQPALREAPSVKLTDAKAQALIKGSEDLYADLSKEARKGLTPAAFKRQLESAWHSYEELERLIKTLEERANA